MNTQSKIKWGIIGAGIIANKLAEALQLDPDSELVAVASRTPGKADAFAAKYSIRAADSYEALVQDPGIDVVYIATTHNFHHENAMLALRHGKNLLVEKAFTVNASQAREMVDLARQNNCFMMEAIWTRFLPSIGQVKELVASGRIGQLRHLSLTFGGFVPEHFRTRLITPELAGGVTLDMGIYPISFICHVLEELPSEIKSMARFGDTGVDELATYQFRFPSGRTAVVSTSHNLLMKTEAMLYGTLGYIDFPRFQQGQEFSLAIHNGSNQVQEVESFVVENHPNGFIYQVAEVVRCLRAGKLESNIIPLDESVAIMEVMDRMRAEWGFKYPFE